MQMQLVAIVALLLVGRLCSAEQQQPPQEVSNVQPVGSPQMATGGPTVVEQQAPPASGPMHQHAGQSYPGEQHTHEHQVAPAHYAPAGIIQVVGAESGKPQQVMRQFAAPAAGAVEQYGQPESAGIPANYKPFGSWGLYIGGNPADGYYSNYYKALSNSVDKQQISGEQAKPAMGGMSGGNQAAAFGPMVKQASSYPYGSYGGQEGQAFHPFDYYTPADLNSGSRVSMSESPAAMQMGGSGPSTYAAGSSSARFMSPVQMGTQMYGAQASNFNENAPAYAESYSTKRFGSAASSQFAQKPEQSPAKGYQQQPQPYQQYASYSSASMAGMQPQVVAYPVPVGSQMVGSQPGVEGSFQPYGVHGFTRYAVKPTVVGADQSSYYHHGVHSSPASQFPAYKPTQQQAQQQQQQHMQQYGSQHAPVYQPMSFYGYPMSQLHYSQGSVVPAFGVQQQGGTGVAQTPSVGPMQSGNQVMGVQESHSPVGVGMSGGQVEAAGSEKSESEVEKPPAVSGVNKQQKRA